MTDNKGNLKRNIVIASVLVITFAFVAFLVVADVAAPGVTMNQRNATLTYVNINGTDNTNISIMEIEVVNMAGTGVNNFWNYTFIHINVTGVPLTNVEYVDGVYFYNGSTGNFISDNISLNGTGYVSGIWNAHNNTILNMSQNASGTGADTGLMPETTPHNFTLNITVSSSIPTGSIINVSIMNYTNGSDTNITPNYGAGVAWYNVSAGIVKIDNMGPTITVNTPSNQTNTTDPALAINATIFDNMSAYDSGAGVANGTVWFALNNGSICSSTWFNPDNGSNFSSASWDDVAVRMHNLTGNGWNATINTTSFTEARYPGDTDGTVTNLDDNYYICVYAADLTGVYQPTAGVNNTGYANSTMITIDNTNPTMVITLSSSGLIVGESTTISCACTDSTSNCTSGTTSITITKPNGDNITSHTSGTAYAPGTTGTYTVTCAGITDYAGNTGTTGTSTFSVSASGSSGDGGGGGGGVVVATSEAISISQLNPSEPFTQEFEADIGVPEITIEVSETRANIKLQVNKYSDKPEAVTAKSGADAYAYLELVTTNLEDEFIKDASITFTVDNTWLTEHEIDPATVKLSRYVDGVWTELETELVSEGGTVTTFKAKTPGFSFFVVTGIGPDTVKDEGLATYWIWVIIGAVLVVAAILYFATKKMGQ